MANYTITLTPEYDAALAQFVKDSGSTAEALLQSASMGCLQSRVEAIKSTDAAMLIDVFSKAAAGATKEDVIAAHALAKANAALDEASK